MSRRLAGSPRRGAKPLEGRTAPAGAAGAATPRAIEPVISRENRWIKWFRAALAGEAIHGAEAAASREAGARAEREPAREAAGIEGVRLVETALRSGVETAAVLVSDSGMRHLAALGPLVPSSARLLQTNDLLFAQVSGVESPQGIAAIIYPRQASFDDLTRGVPLILVMAGLQDPGNVGTLVRAAEALGATGAAACAAGGIGTASPYSPKALRASAGAALRLPILRGVAAPVLLAQLRVAGVRIYAACPEDPRTAAPLDAWQADFCVASALLIGNEGAGLPAELVRSADAVVTIPARVAGGPAGGDRAESLNAGTAGAILLYEAARQRAKTLASGIGGGPA